MTHTLTQGPEQVGAGLSARGPLPPAQQAFTRAWGSQNRVLPILQMRGGGRGGEAVSADTVRAPTSALPEVNDLLRCCCFMARA